MAEPGVVGMMTFEEWQEKCRGDCTRGAKKRSVGRNVLPRAQIGGLSHTANKPHLGNESSSSDLEAENCRLKKLVDLADVYQTHLITELSAFKAKNADLVAENADLTVVLAVSEFRYDVAVGVAESAALVDQLLDMK